MAESRPSPYTVRPGNKFFAANLYLAESEIRAGVSVTFFGQVDLSGIERMRAEAERSGGAKPSYTSFVVKAVALGLREFPYANQRVWRRWWLPWGASLQRFESCDVSVACERDIPDAEGVAFVDILRGAERKSLEEVSEFLRALATCDLETNERWRGFANGIARLPGFVARAILHSSVLFPSVWAKHRGGAAIVSSPSKYGVDAVAATWQWPLGISFGLVEPRPLVRDGQIVIRPTFTLTLAFDRRIMAGGPAGRFFRRIVEILENPEKEIDAGV